MPVILTLPRSNSITRIAARRRFSSRLTFNVGFRYDRNTSKDQGGVEVLRDQQWSPRLGLSWDIRGNGKWIANTISVTKRVSTRPTSCR